MNFDTYLKVMNYTVVILMHLMVVLIVLGSIGAIVGWGLLLFGSAFAKSILLYSLGTLVGAFMCGIMGIAIAVWGSEQ